MNRRSLCQIFFPVCLGCFLSGFMNGFKITSAIKTPSALFLRPLHKVKATTYLELLHNYIVYFYQHGMKVKYITILSQWRLMPLIPRGQRLKSPIQSTNSLPHTSIPSENLTSRITGLPTPKDTNEHVACQMEQRPSLLIMVGISTEFPRLYNSRTKLIESSRLLSDSRRLVFPRLPPTDPHPLDGEVSRPEAQSHVLVCRK